MAAVALFVSAVSGVFRVGELLSWRMRMSLRLFFVSMSICVFPVRSTVAHIMIGQLLHISVCIYWIRVRRVRWFSTISRSSTRPPARSSLLPAMPCSHIVFRVIPPQKEENELQSFQSKDCGTSLVKYYGPQPICSGGSSDIVRAPEPALC